MGSPGPEPEVTLADALAVFGGGGNHCTPLTASEVAEALGCTRRTAHRKLEALAERGDLRTKKTGARSRVWWQPPGRQAGGTETARAEDEPGSTAVRAGSPGEEGAVTDASDAFYSLDGELRFEYVTEQAAAVLGKPADALLGERVADALPDATGEALAERFREALDGDEPVAFERDSEFFGARTEIRAYPSAVGLAVYVRDVTDRIERERQLEQSRRRYQTLVEHFPNGAVALVDEDLRYIAVGGTPASEITDDAADLEGRPVGEVLEPAFAEVLEPRYEAALSGESSSFEYEREGRHFRIRIFPVRDEDDAVFAAMGMSQDVTEQVERERRYRTLLENVPGMVYRCRNEPDWPMEFVSEGCRDLTGYDPETLERGDVSFGADVVHEDDREELWEAVQRGLDEDGRFLVTYRVRTPEGDVRWVRERGRGVFDEDGELSVLEGVIIDVTERKRLETELREVFGRVSAAFYALDDQYRFTHANERAEELLDVSEDELLGETLWEAFPETAEVADIRERLQTAMEAQEATSIEIYSELLDFWVEANIYPSETGLSVYFRDVTERKERERELERYERIVENLPVGVYRNTPGPDGEFVEANPTLASIFDADSLAELTTCNVSDLYVDSARRAEFSRRLEDEGMVRGVELRQETLDGRPIWISVTAIRTEEDGRVYFDGVVQDVTERKAREEELKRYEVLFTESRDVNVVLDADGTYRYVTPSMAHEFGHDPDELVGESAFDYVHPEDRERVAEEFATLVEDPELKPTVEYRFRHADGSWRVIESRGRNLLDEPAVEGIVVYSRDVTEQRERERQLAESERRYRALAENFPNGGVGVFDSDLRYTLVTGTMWDDIEPDVADLAGETIRDALPPETAADVEPIFRGALAGETGSVVSKLGGRTYRVWATPLRDADGEVVAGQSFAMDITDQLARQRRLEASNERLEQFAYVTSHDLQEPLRMISNYLQLLADRYSDDLPADAREFVEYAVDGADRMRAMIDDLLEYSRVDTRADPPTETDANAVLDRVLDQLRFRIQETGATVEVGDLPTVFADANQLEQVFQNLVANAIKYRGDEPPRIEIDGEAHGDGWRFRVSDNGIGMDPGHLDRIFEVFQRLHTHDEYEGTGIGLALCRRIVERHGGEIQVESEPGQGSTFHFTLAADPEEGVELPPASGGRATVPAGTAHADESQDAAPDATATADGADARVATGDAGRRVASDDSGGGPAVATATDGSAASPVAAGRRGDGIDLLLVEDNPGDVRLLREAFGDVRADVTVHAVSDGEAALAFLRRDGQHADAPRPDVTLLDLDLPKVDGMAVLGAVRDDPALHRLPVIVLSSSAAPDDVARSYDRAANAYLTKPGGQKEFRDLARSLERFWFERASLPPVPE